MEEEFGTNNTKIREEYDSKKIATSLDHLNFDIMSYFSKQRKSSEEMMNQYKNYFKIDPNKDLSEDILRQKFPGKRSVVYNNNEILRFSNFDKKNIKDILSSTTFPKSKLRMIKKYANKEESSNSKKNIEKELKNNNDNNIKENDVMTCTNLLNQLVYIKKGDIINKNKTILIKNKDIEKEEEKKVVPRLNLLTKLVKKPRNSEYKKIVKFKANDDIENLNKAKCRHRSVKKKLLNMSFEDEYLHLKYKKISNEMSPPLNLRRTTRRNQTVVTRLNLLDNFNKKEKEEIKELGENYWGKNLNFSRKYSGNVFLKNKRKTDANNDLLKSMKMKDFKKFARKSMYTKTTKQKLTSITITLKPLELEKNSSDEKDKKNKKEESFADKQMKKLKYKQKQLDKDIILYHMKNNSDMKPAPEINKKSEDIMKKKGKYIPLYKRALDIQNEKKFNSAVMLETKKAAELSQNYATSKITPNKDAEKKFFYNQIKWKKKVNKKTVNLRNLLNNRKEESLTQNLTFRPKLNEKTVLIASKKRISKSNDKNNIFIRLYKESAEKEKNLNKLQKKYKPNFQPIIYNKSPNIITKKNNIIQRNIDYKINISRTNYNKKKNVIYIEEELSLNSYPSLIINDSIFNDKNNNNKENIIPKNNTENIKKKTNKESYVSSTTDLCTDRNKNNLIPGCSSKMIPIIQEPKCQTERQYIRCYSSQIKNPNNFKNFIASNNKISPFNSNESNNIKNWKLDNVCKTDRLIVRDNNLNYNNNELKVELWTIDDIGENLSTIKSEESWAEKLKSDSLNFKDILNENKQELMDTKEKSVYKVRNNNLFSINLNNIENSNNQLKPNIVKGKQNIFYKYFKKKE